MKSKIILKDVGRNKINKTIEVENPISPMGKRKYTELDLAEMAYKECDKHLMSRSVELEPNEGKGDGFWNVLVGGFRQVGEVEIVI